MGKCDYEDLIWSWDDSSIEAINRLKIGVGKKNGDVLTHTLLDMCEKDFYRSSDSSGINNDSDSLIFLTSPS